jgi:hypothetical protein
VGRLIGVQVLSVTRVLARVRELFSTKGWKAPYEIALHHLKGEPKVGSFHRGSRRRFGDWSDSGRWMRNRAVKMTAFPKGHLERHSWYRRQQRDAFNA